ncbi:MAG TPA: DpnI domain-containing protein [Vitreimonas sp.]|uniref:DpnI domain-containing protein n=1 Tax=Vitreimonas sp. TaxID=3069702 RepID=UPI002D3ECFF6|nr:DpnI domain-containing protein [Vitreimonas sp.]HYD86495.1 DpnI domain-containing protein [Vitreimonas sp.]
MRLGFREESVPYDSGSQRARFWTEEWAGRELYCLNCGAERLRQLPNNTPVGDLVCDTCKEEYELKSQARKSDRVPDGAYRTMLERLAAGNNPSLMLLSYDRARHAVTNVAVVPKHFFVPDIIEARKPLKATARRAGWVGCNILLSKVPEAGRIYVVRNGAALPKDLVLENWSRTAFLQDMRLESRGWLLEVLKCTESIGRAEFELSDVYAFEAHMQQLYPGNQHVREKMRQQLQVLRDKGFIEFLGRGRYRMAKGVA